LLGWAGHNAQLDFTLVYNHHAGVALTYFRRYKRSD